MSMEQFEKTVKAWEENGFIFEEHARVTANAIPGQPAFAGLHGVLRSEDDSLTVKARMGVALKLAKDQHVHTFLTAGVDKATQIWGGEHKMVRLSPREAEVALFSDEVFQSVVLKVRAIRNVLQRSFLYLQEDDDVLWASAILNQMEWLSIDYLKQPFVTVVLTTNTKLLHKTIPMLVEDEKFERGVLGGCYGQLSQEVTASLFAGIQFLNTLIAK